MTAPRIPTDADVELARVERSVRIDAPLDDVWAAIADPSALGEWLGGELHLDRPLGPGAAGELVAPDGSVRQLLVTEHRPGERLAWHWWDDDELSSVEITACPDGDATEVHVVEVVALARAASAPASLASGTIEAIDRTWSTALPSLAARLGRKLCAAPA
jgi:uncharacterized protein YndB with AHSA1/START domain